MRSLTLACALLLGSASAAGLIGSSTSFPASSFCKTYRCLHVETLPVASDMKVYTYAIPGDPLPGLIRVTRKGKQVVSAGYRTGGQDWVFPVGSPNNRELADLIGAATGVRPSADWVSKMKCPSDTSITTANAYKAASRQFTVACTLNSGDNFVYFDIAIY